MIYLERVQHLQVTNSLTSIVLNEPTLADGAGTSRPVFIRNKNTHIQKKKEKEKRKKRRRRMGRRRLRRRRIR